MDVSRGQTRVWPAVGTSTVGSCDMRPWSPARSLGLLLAAVLTAILTLLAGPVGAANAVPASASATSTATVHTAPGPAGPAAETRVWDSTVSVASFVGAAGDITAGQRWDNAPAQAQPASATSVAAEDVSIIPARALRFTQDSAGSTFRNGGSVEDLAHGLADGTVDPNSIEPIRVFAKDDGNLYSLDNRRLFAGQFADANLPFRWATPAEIAARNQTQVLGGTGITIRGLGWWSLQ